MLKTSIIHVDSEVMDLGMIWVLGYLGTPGPAASFG